MDWKNESAAVKCPFYVSHSLGSMKKAKWCIRCEEMKTERGYPGMMFRTEKDRTKFMRGYCDDKYYRCPVFRMLAEKLTEKEDE